MSYLRQRGFVNTILLLVIAFVLVKVFFGLDPKAAIELVWGYIRTPVMFAWDRIFWPVLSLAWNNLQQLIHTGEISGMPNLPTIPGY